MISDATIEDVRERTDIVQVIGDRLPLKRASGGFVACCPFHHEKTPSFHVSPRRQRFHCFGCGEDGDVFKFLMKHDGMAFLDSVKYLAEKCGVEIVESAPDPGAARAKRLLLANAEAAAFFRRCLLRMPEAEVARAYLEKRGLSGETAEKFGLGYDPDRPGTLDAFARANRFTQAEMVAAGLGTLPEGVAPGTPGASLRDRFHGRLMFPIRDHGGRVVAFSARVLDSSKSRAKYVNSPETDVFKKSRVLYALDQAQRAIAASKHREAILCEGQIDVIRCHACGFPRAVASEGTAFTAEHAALLHRYADSAILLFDGDNAGRKAAVRTAGILLAEGIPARVASLPQGEDPDSFLLANPPEAFQKVLDGASGIVAFHVAYLKAQESDPDGPDAAGRIVDGVLETVAACSNSVHKARMVQEVARELDLPESVVRDRLAGVEETIRRRSEMSDRRAAFVEAREAERSAAAAPPGGGGALRTAASSGPAPDAIDVAVCEFMLFHGEEEPGTLHAFAKLMPATLFPCTLVRRLVEAFYASVGASTDPVADLQRADAAVADFVARVSASHDRVGSSESFRPADVARELVLAVWRRHVKSRMAATSGDVSPEAMRKRMADRKALFALETWETGEALVRDLAGVPPSDSPAPAPPAAPAFPDGGPAPEAPEAPEAPGAGLGGPSANPFGAAPGPAPAPAPGPSAPAPDDDPFFPEDIPDEF